MLLERRERGTVGEERSAAVTVARMGLLVFKLSMLP